MIIIIALLKRVILNIILIIIKLFFNLTNKIIIINNAFNFNNIFYSIYNYFIKIINNFFNLKLVYLLIINKKNLSKSFKKQLKRLMILSINKLIHV